MIDIEPSDSFNGSTSIPNNNNDNDADYTSPISTHIDSISPSLRHLSLEIHDNPEVRNKEFIAHDAITKYINEQKGQKWEVTPSAYGIATAFVAVCDSGRPGPVASFNAEYGELDVWSEIDMVEWYCMGFSVID